METRLEKIIKSIGPLDQAAMDAARARQAQLTKPVGSLGRLEELSIQLAGITANPRPGLVKRAVFICAADHGVARSGVSAYPAEVTPQMVFNFLARGAAINVLARRAGARVVVADIGVDYDFGKTGGLKRKKVARATADLSRGPAMSREQAVKSVISGIELVEEEIEENGLDILATGDMGIGNTTPSAAIAAALTGHAPALVTGRGTGVDEAGLARKVEAVGQALAINRPDPNDGLDVLAKVGGFEIGAIAGLILAGAARRVPVVLDGFISGAGALIAQALAPGVEQYMIAAHRSVEIGHQIMLEKLGLAPLFDLGLRLGEGTGAAMGLMLAECAAAVLDEMATFEEAMVSQKE